jgi:phosphoribosylformimino-5-aminoimidazole carboxamide ribonucleotide (ProFAR) isomerase
MLSGLTSNRLACWRASPAKVTASGGVSSLGSGAIETLAPFGVDSVIVGKALIDAALLSRRQFGRYSENLKPVKAMSTKSDGAY